GLRARLHTALAGIDEIVAPLYQARMDRADAALIQREFAHVAQMLRHGAKRALLQLEGSALSPSALAAELDAIIDEHRAVWLSRNRPGGLDDSAAKLAQARQLFEGEARANRRMSARLSGADGQPRAAMSASPSSLMSVNSVRVMRMKSLSENW